MNGQDDLQGDGSLERCSRRLPWLESLTELFGEQQDFLRHGSYERYARFKRIFESTRQLLEGLSKRFHNLPLVCELREALAQLKKRIDFIGEEMQLRMRGRPVGGLFSTVH